MPRTVSHDAIEKSGRVANSRLAVCFASSGWRLFPIGDHKIGKAKAGASGIISLQSSNRLLGSS